MGKFERLSRWQLGVLLMGVYVLGLVAPMNYPVVSFGVGAIVMVVVEKYGE